MCSLAPPPDEMPDLTRVILPSRAFFLSWLHQTVPARVAAIDDGEEHYGLLAGASSGVQDMAVAAVIGESIQPFEDLAYLATAWDEPYSGIATYVRATTWKRFTASNFWQEVRKWDDARLDVFAGFAGRNPDTQGVESLIETLPLLGVSIDERVLEAMQAARDATLQRLKSVLRGLGDDWKQFSPYQLAYKHGGLILNREDMAFTTDDVEELTASVARHEPSLAVWTRAGRRQPIQADFNLGQSELVRYVAESGRLVVALCEAFVRARIANIDALEFSPSGKLLGLKPMHLPWTVWLREGDLERSIWETLGAGPTIRWASDDR